MGRTAKTHGKGPGYGEGCYNLPQEAGDLGLTHKANAQGPPGAQQGIDT